ncbi:MAG TPA: ABC-type transport auxiliary lipoprotein family protein [Gammaproteobacteria bacterium]|nr:ABC-type transport auxiliary lipoprotein family protein [Gammaproteobacteria bacterium]
MRHLRLLGVTALLVLSACAKAPPVPTDTYYRLTAPQVGAATKLTTGIILVRPLMGDGLHSDRAILHAEDAQGAVLTQYSYHFWTEAPPRMIQHQLIDYLRAAQSGRMVVGELDGGPALTVSGRIKEFERLDGGSQTTVRVDLELRLDDAHGQPLLVQDYSEHVPAGGDDLGSTATAFDQALNTLFTRFLADASKAVAADH